jgi:hypothetical protein
MTGEVASPWLPDGYRQYGDSSGPGSGGFGRIGDQRARFFAKARSSVTRRSGPRYPRVSGLS